MDLSSIDIKQVIELALVVITIKLIVKRYKPPIQESIQAIICITIGVGLSLAMNHTIQGFVYGVVGAGVAFYGGDLIDEFRGVKNVVLEELKEDEKYIKKK